MKYWQLVTTCTYANLSEYMHITELVYYLAHSKCLLFRSCLYFNSFKMFPDLISFKMFPDLIAIPDFSAGAMENWGLITYRETSLLFSESQTSVIAKQWIAVVVAHELAHQWFGNLVTMKWWNDIWLNEGEKTKHCCHENL